MFEIYVIQLKEKTEFLVDISTEDMFEICISLVICYLLDHRLYCVGHTHFHYLSYTVDSCVYIAMTYICMTMYGAYISACIIYASAYNIL